MPLKQQIKKHPILFAILFILILALIIVIGFLIYDNISDKGERIETNSLENCQSDSYNCADFETQAEAQVMFVACGGSDNDIHQLDNDGDGVVCESLG